MQDAPLPGTPPPPARRGLERSTSFLVVAIVAAVGMGIVFWMGRGESGSRDRGSQNEHSVASAERQEVAAAVELLLRQNAQAFAARNPSVLADVFVAGSPAALRADKGMERLREADVYEASREEVNEVEVKDITPTTAFIEVKTTVYPCFRDSDGKDVTDSSGVVEQVSLYELRRVGDGWRIYDAIIEQSKVLVREKSSCARV